MTGEVVVPAIALALLLLAAVVCVINRLQTGHNKPWAIWTFVIALVLALIILILFPSLWLQ